MGTTMLSVAFDPDDGGADDGGGISEDLRLELNSLRAGLEAVRAECNGLRKRLDAEVKNRRVEAGPSHFEKPDTTKNVAFDRINDDLKALKNMILTERNFRGSMRMECDELQKQIQEDKKELEMIRFDFDGLVEIMDEELENIRKREPKKNSIIVGLTQSIRKTREIRASMPGGAGLAEMSLLRGEVDELKDILTSNGLVSSSDMPIRTAKTEKATRSKGVQ